MKVFLLVWFILVMIRAPRSKGWEVEGLQEETEKILQSLKLYFCAYMLPNNSSYKLQI